MTIAGYVRVSSALQRDQGDSPANQREALRRAGCTRFFEDLAVSGFREATRHRATGWAALWEAIAKGELTELKVTRLDRVARKDSWVLQLLEHCENHSVEFITLAGGVVDTSNPAEWLSVRLQLSVNEHYSRALSASIKAGIKAARQRGVPARNIVPFHLARDPNVPVTAHKFVPSQGWKAARQAVELILEGGSTTQAAQLLREAGFIRTRTGVLSWLRNSLLMGEVYGIPDAAPALVTPEEFDRIDAQLRQNRRNWGANAASARRPPAETPLRGLCVCSECGSLLQQTHNRPGSWRLRCTHDGCSRCFKSVTQHRLEPQLADLILPRLEELYPAMQPRGHKPTREELKLRSELRKLEQLAAESDFPGYHQRIAELKRLIQAVQTVPRTGGLMFMQTREFQMRRDHALLVMLSDGNRDPEDHISEEMRRRLWLRLLPPRSIEVDAQAKRITRLLI